MRLTNLVSSVIDLPLQNDLLKDALLRTGCVAVLASEEDEEPVVGSEGGKFVVAFDPLDGSRNIDAGIPTGQPYGKSVHVKR